MAAPAWPAMLIHAVIVSPPRADEESLFSPTEAFFTSLRIDTILAFQVIAAEPLSDIFVFPGVWRRRLRLFQFSFDRAQDGPSAPEGIISLPPASP